jgi:hypothetical protein
MIVSAPHYMSADDSAGQVKERKRAYIIPLKTFAGSHTYNYHADIIW